MTNDEVYAAGILGKALDPKTQPDAIRSFLRAEQEVIEKLVPPGARVVDFGCGMGRHLIAIRPRLSLGVGIDYERSYVAEAVKAQPTSPLHFLVADATAAPFRSSFDIALCLTNTWGTMTDKVAVLDEMRRLAPKPRTRFITVYTTSSIRARSAWYANMGYPVIEVTDERIVAAGGFGSEHFTEERLRRLVGPCDVRTLGNIAYVVQT
jgi:SAM-dependent methyltransferase